MFKTIDLTIEVLRMRTVKANTSHNRSNWKHLRITQEIRVRHTGKARIQRTTENIHIGHGTYSPECTDVNYKTFIMGKSNYM